MKFLRTFGVTPLLALVLTSTARGDFLDGRLIDSNGNGVAGANISATYFGGGGSVLLVNAGTDPLGFFHVTIPAGTFTVTFEPPQPPASSGLQTDVEPVSVSGTTNIGNVMLTPGVVLSGQVVDGGQNGVPGINFDVIDASGDNVDLRYDFTDGSGFFVFAAPIGSTELRLDTTPVSGTTLAPRAISMNATSNTDFGTIVLQPGYVVTALVRNPSALAVANCDVDVIDATTGIKLYTPGDDTNTSGFVDIVVPAGSLRFQFCAPVATRLVVREIGPSTITGNTSLGVVTLQSGMILSGTIRDGLGQPVVNADVDMRDHVTLAEILLCGEASNGAGQYVIVIPTGTFDVFFDGPIGSGLGTQAHVNVAVGADTTLDGTLPNYSAYCFGDGSGTACPCGNNAASGSGTGCLSSLGTGGRLVASGAASIAADTLVLRGAQMPSSSALYFQGTTQMGAGAGAVFGDGLRCAAGAVLRLGTKTNAGGASQYPVAGDLPISVKGANAAGGTRTYQIWYRNAAVFCSASTFNLTNGIQLPWAS